MNNKLIRKSILTSYIIGLPIGLIFSFILFSIPVMLTGEGLATFAIVGAYGKAIIGLLFSFLFALGYSGFKVYGDLIANRTLINTSFRYSLRVNIIIWTLFTIITLLDNINDDPLIYMIFPIVAFVFCVPLTTFTVGLVICKTIKDKFENK